MKGSGATLAHMDIEEVKRRWDRTTFRRTPHPKANRAARVAWQFAYWLLFRPSPHPLHRWRCAVLRWFGAKVGKRVRIHRTVRIWAPWNLDIGDYCSIGDGVDVYSVGRIEIGAQATVSQGAVLCTATHDYTLLHFPLVVGRITLDPYVWICAEAFVMPDVRIGEGTVVGVRSTVSEDLPAWKVAAGSPCRVLKDRVVRLDGESCES